MNTKELINKYGYSVAMTDESKVTCVLVTKDCSLKEATKIANNYLKYPIVLLRHYNAWLKGDKVFFEKTDNAKEMWAISRCKIG